MKDKIPNKVKPKLFNLKLFPMDLARFVCFTMPLFFRIKKIYVTDKAREKLKHSAIISANHTCFKDPLLLGCCFWYRRMFFLAAEVVMQNKIVAFLLKGVGCIKINRNICDIESIRNSVAVLKKGHILSLFPTGGITRDDDLSAIKSGIILMSMQAKSPIIPVYVHRKAKKGDRNCVVIGEPIDIFSTEAIPSLADINTCADTVLEKMQECKAIYEKYAEEKI